jgi:serine/threonine protein kinase
MGRLMSQKIPIHQLIQELRNIGCYEAFTQNKLDLLGSALVGATEISQKERLVTRQAFASFIDAVAQKDEIRFLDVADTSKSSQGAKVVCHVKQFLGFGNTGPVYAVAVDGQPFALKIYSATGLNDMMQTHGTFGLMGVLLDKGRQEAAPGLSDIGQKVLARKAKGVYGRCNRIVKIHRVGQDGDRLYLLMDLLQVDPISKVDPAQIGGDLVDLVSWAVDCAVGLCHLHVEERRLHLNIRPEAFIRKVRKSGDRLPKYTFFNYPKKFYRPESSPCLNTEFIMVDHLDNSVDIGDSSPKGLGSIGSWAFVPPEAILALLQILRDDYQRHVEQRIPVEAEKAIRIKRSQMDDIWALGLTFYQFLSRGKFPFGEPKTLADLVHSVLLTKFDFSGIDPGFRELVSSMLDKDPKKRFQRLLEGCPEKMQSRRVLAEAVLFKLEDIALQLSA